MARRSSVHFVIFGFVEVLGREERNKVERFWILRVL